MALSLQHEEENFDKFKESSVNFSDEIAFRVEVSKLGLFLTLKRCFMNRIFHRNCRL